MSTTVKPRAVRKPSGGRSLRLQGILVFCLLAGFASFNVAFGLILDVWFGLSLLLMVLLIGLLGSRIYRRLRQVMRQRGRFVRRLRFAEARKRSILDSAGDGIITVDEHGVVRSFNRAATRIFGYAPSEALGHGFSLFLPLAGAGNAEALVNTGEALILGTSGGLCGRRKDGSRFPVEPAVSKIRVGGRRYFTYVVRDLTDQKQAEDSLRRARDELEARVQERTAQLADTVVVLRNEVAERRRAEAALRASEEKFAKAFHGSPDAILITTLPEGRLVEVNHSFQTLTGYGREEVLGRTTPELKVWVRPEDRERYL